MKILRYLTPVVLSALLAACGGGGGGDAVETAPPAGSTSQLTVQRSSADGTVTSSPAGIDCGTDCSEGYVVGTQVTLTAVPKTGFDFSGWTTTGDNSVVCTGTAPCQVTVGNAATVQAVFSAKAAAKYPLQLAVVAPTGTAAGVSVGRVTTADTTVSCASGATDTCVASYASGVSVTLKAEPATGYKFDRWSVSDVTCPATDTCTVPMTASRSVAAVFSKLPVAKQLLSVSLSSAGAGAIASINANGIVCPGDCSEAYDQGSLIRLGATPAPNYVFTGWEGACTGTGACEVTLDAAKSVVAKFAAAPASTIALNTVVTGGGKGSITSSPAGIACGTDCTESYASGTSVTLTATPAEGNTFTGWSGMSCTGTTPTCTVSLTSNLTAAAQFAPIVKALNVSKTGYGTVTSAPAGIDCGATCTTKLNVGTSVTLTATPAAGYRFTGWNGACTGTAACTVSVANDTAVGATFEVIPPETIQVAVTRAGAGTGSVVSTPAGIDCGTTCTSTVTKGTSVRLVATAAANSTFTGWTGACTGTGECVVPGTANASVQASFDANETTSGATAYYVTVVRTGSGTVTTDPAGVNCGTNCRNMFPANKAVTFKAVPATGYTFAGWTGSCTGSGATCSTTTSKQLDVNALFKATTTTVTNYTLTVTRTGSGTVTSSGGTINCGSTCSTTVASGTNAILTATPATGYTFTGWSGACSGTGTCSTIMSTDRAVTANFVAATPASYTLAVTKSGSGTVSSTSGSISCGSTCSATVVAGTAVTLNATPASGYTFSGWSGACSGTGACAVTVNAAASVSATFTATVTTPTTAALTVTRGGSGSVVSSPAGISCGSTCSASFNTGTTVALTATPDAGYTFSGWSGACSGTGSCSVALSAASSVTANFAAVQSGSTKYVPLSTVAGPVATGVPLRTGVPFPVGALTDITKLRLETEAGAEVPAQFTALAYWPDGSIKVALTHLVGDLGTAKNYRVAYGAGVSRAALPRNVQVTGTPGSEITVDTGLVKFAVDGKGIIQKVWRDANANGAFDTTEQVIDSGEIFMVNAKDNAEYTASAATNAVVTIEENGPMRAVIKATGSLTNSSGTRLIKYLVRYYANQGSDKVDIETSVIDDSLEANVEVVASTFPIAGKSLGMRWTYVADTAAAYRFGGENGAAYGGTVSGEHYLAQSGKFNYVNGEDKGHTFSYAGVGTGTKAPGWVALDSGNRHVALMVRDFWQQFPNELKINGKTLTAELFPARSVGATAQTSAPAPTNEDYIRANTLYFTRNGGAKTYQLRLAFDAATPQTTALASLNDSYQRHVLNMVSTPDWYAASGVFGDLNVGASAAGTTGYNAMLMKDIYEASVEKTDGNATMFGWRDYGDRLRAGWNVVNGVRVPSFYNDTHVGANNFFTQFLRTGDQRWYGIAEIATNHFRDIDVSHGPRAGYWSTGGQPQPAGEVLAMSHESIDHQVRNLHWGHSHVSGMSDSYLLTGDKRSYDVLSEIAGWWKFVSPYFFQRPFKSTDKYREAERDYGWPLYVMNEWVRVSGDATYHKEVAGGLVDYLNQWFRTPLDHIGYNPATGVMSNNVINQNNAAAGTGYWTMTKMDNNMGYNATGTNPWMAGAFVGNIIKFYEADQLFTAAGKGSGLNRTQIVDMMLQGMDYIVKYGYDDTKQWFVYSEVTRTYSGGDTHIIYPLAYLDRLYKQEKAAGRLVNSSWYTTQPKWSTIATRRYDELNSLKVGASTQSFGFYGYEMVYPADYFKVMQDTLGR